MLTVFVEVNRLIPVQVSVLRTVCRVSFCVGMNSFHHMYEKDPCFGNKHPFRLNVSQLRFIFELILKRPGVVLKQCIGFMVAMICMVWVAGAVEKEPTPTISSVQLTERLYLLATDQGAYTTNTIVSVGDDGILLVDTQSEGDAKALKDAVDAFERGSPRFIINTHRHVEHVGGNAAFGSEPIVIAHDLVPEKLRSGSYLFNEFPDATFPDITFSETMTLRFNGEQIRLTAMTGSHDDNEIIVHFVDSNVVHLSSLVNGFNFPSVDTDGDPLMFKTLVKRAIEMLPSDVVIVSGHNGHRRVIPVFGRGKLTQPAFRSRAFTGNEPQS